MALIQISDLTFCYDGSYDNIFEETSFQIDTDWKLGLIGRNGRGKSTLLKLLMGKHPYGGSISSPVAFDCFPREAPDRGQSCAALLGEMFPDAEEWRLLYELSLLDVDPGVLDRPFCSLSGGERTKLLLAGLFQQEDKFPLIDEPTNHLDLLSRRKVAEYLRQARQGFLLVSHDRALLDGCVDHILSINRASIEVRRGNFTSWRENRERQDQWEFDRNERLKKDVKRLAAAARRTSDWSDKVEKTKKGPDRPKCSSGLKPDKGFIGHKAAKMMKRAKTLEARRETALEEKASLLKDIETVEALKIQTLPCHAARLVEARELSISYGGRAVLRGLNLEVGRGERIALTGPNGSGKTSLFRLLLGEPLEHGGALRLGSGLTISYLPQDTSFLRGGLDALIACDGLDEPLFKALLRKLDFTREQFGKELSQFSEGQKKKVLLARSLCRPAHLYLWDEPLNYIDLLSRMQIERLLLDFAPTMLFVEHDAAFVRSVATRTIELAGKPC